jgi:predicted nucleic acid-binding protein
MANTIRFLEHNPLRAMDAIHLGCAVAYQPDVFVSADRHQIGAAAQIGLNTVDLSGA